MWRSSDIHAQQLLLGSSCNLYPTCCLSPYIACGCVDFPSSLREGSSSLYFTCLPPHLPSTFPGWTPACTTGVSLYSTSGLVCMPLPNAFSITLPATFYLPHPSTENNRHCLCLPHSSSFHLHFTTTYLTPPALLGQLCHPLSPIPGNLPAASHASHYQHLYPRIGWVGPQPVTDSVTITPVCPCPALPCPPHCRTGLAHMPSLVPAQPSASPSSL